ncbi:MAG: HD domain-containing protein [Candidatus Omnitrophica bacterium]|jgi:putative nucleotidyltransferase with HDIG domain|nr:HD domain-containing protein [Candidatus Omnitrophota bacterium]
MKSWRLLFASFRFKVALFIITSLLLVTALSDILIYRFAINSQFQQIRQRLKIIAQTVSLLIDADAVTQVPLSKDGINSPAYKSISEKLQAIKKASPSLKYIYIVSQTDTPGIVQFVVDPDIILKEKGRITATSYPGDKYDTSVFPEMTRGFYEPSADKKFGKDQWGIFLSGYAPIRNKDGKSVALLGVDMTAEDIYITQRHMKMRAILVFIFGTAISLIFGLFITGTIAKRIEKIVTGTRRIAKNDFNYRLNTSGNDEIAELAQSFNKMSEDLSESRERMHHYFYRVVQSLVRLLEARDPYTLGHSERVAGYAYEIAVTLKLPKPKIDLVRKAAELHDIGKLAVPESILNKVGPLSEAEWEIIKKHPSLGEEILKPVFLEDEFISIIRSHHERYDGKGYPDKLKKDDIKLLSQIISVADAYDAMTSQRAYKKILSQKEAILELKKNIGSQFKEEVVMALVSYLEETK